MTKVGARFSALNVFSSVSLSTTHTRPHPLPASHPTFPCCAATPGLHHQHRHRLTHTHPHTHRCPATYLPPLPLYACPPRTAHGLCCEMFDVASSARTAQQPVLCVRCPDFVDMPSRWVRRRSLQLRPTLSTWSICWEISPAQHQSLK